MELWFYKSECGDWKDRLISWWTLGPYSHVELAFSNGLFFSSSLRDGGCRFTTIDHSEHWEIVSLKRSMEEMAARFVENNKVRISPEIIADHYEYKVQEWCEHQVGKPYDWLSIIGFAFRCNKFEKRNRWYCSEVILRALNQVGLWSGECRLHPNQMYDAFVQRNCSPNMTPQRVR
jgi:hypothetical protein